MIIEHIGWEKNPVGKLILKQKLIVGSGVLECLMGRYRHLQSNVLCQNYSEKSKRLLGRISVSSLVVHFTWNCLSL